MPNFAVDNVVKTNKITIRADATLKISQVCIKFPRPWIAN